MLATAMIAANFVRTQWLAITVMTVYLLGIAAVFGVHEQSQEVVFFFQSHSFYVLFLGIMLAVPAIQTERKSRRILCVLSKGIHRWQYLGGLLWGAGSIAAYFCLVVGVITLLLCRRAGYPVEGLWPLTLALFACCLAAIAAGLFYATFLHPLLATAATALTLTLPLLTGPLGWRLPGALFPVAWLADLIRSFHFERPDGTAGLGTSALLATLVFWIAGSAVFTRRDVTTSPE